MGKPDPVVSANIPELLEIAKGFDTSATDAAAMTSKLAGVTGPSAAVYGWEQTAAAMTAVLDGWRAEIAVTTTALQDMGSAMRSVVENLREAERLAARRNGMHGL